jgi:propionyl-CoA carboxylase alpha chain
MPPERAVYRHGAASSEAGTIEVGYRRQRDGRFAVRVTGAAAVGGPAELMVMLHGADGGWIDFEEGGRRHRRHVLRRGDQVWVQGPGGDVSLTAVPRFPRPEPQAVAGGLLAPMPGTVVAVHVAPGDTVGAGQLLMIVEAMKMEHRVTAPQAGTVTDVRAHPGDQVSGGDLLAVIDEAT